MTCTRKISKPMLIWLCVNGLVLLWLFARIVLRLRLVYWIDKPIGMAIAIGVLLGIFVGWCMLGLRILFRRSKTLGMITSILYAGAVMVLIAFLVPAMILWLGMASSAEWEITYSITPEGLSIVEVFGGDAVATSRGPYHAAYPMVCKGYTVMYGSIFTTIDLRRINYDPPGPDRPLPDPTRRL